LSEQPPRCRQRETEPFSPRGVSAQGGFAIVNGIKLHYHDWGGQGSVVLFLTGLGDTVDSFSSFAPRFADQFRVMGFTRRGQGDLDKPATVYDSKTLASNIIAFMDAMNLRRAILVGHSIAGIEMAIAATAFPERIEKIVYSTQPTTTDEDNKSRESRVCHLVLDAPTSLPVSSVRLR
jgi:pimeloyl-ACP methyl ester carboxylesterase